jgi:hypothetical protein
VIIETDHSVIFDNKKIYLTNHAGRTEELAEKLCALTIGNRIYRTDESLLDSIRTYTHEAGHYKGEEISFKSGRSFWEKKNIQSLDEIKDRNIHIELSENELVFLKENAFSDKQVRFNGETFNIANKLLKALFRGRFNKYDIFVFNVTQEELDDLVKKEGSSTTPEIDSELVLVNSRESRNDELTSVLTEISCLLILENTMIYYGILAPNECIRCGKVESVYQRAQNIVARAYDSRGWRIPSNKDLKKQS